MLRISLVDQALALHALKYMYILAYIPSGMSIHTSGIENWSQERVISDHDFMNLYFIEIMIYYVA